MQISGERWKLGRRPALDGLRGVAILLVVVCHGFIPWTGGGAEGVSVFFVLSGFLIGSLLLDEHATTGQINAGAFYRRRVVRLLPALAVFLVVMVATGAATWRQAVPAALYIGNWLPTGSLGHLGHTWSLSVEEQFYLLFPLAAIVALRRSRRTLALFCAAGMAASWGIRIAAWGHREWVYQSTLTNAGALLLGVLLAVGVAGLPPFRVRPWLVVGLIGALVVGARTPIGNYLYVGLPMLSALIGGGLLVAVVGDTGARWSVLHASWLRYVGRRSYALYLWHITFVLNAWRINGPHWVGVLVTALAAMGVAELSWWLVERPVVRFARKSLRPSLVWFRVRGLFGGVVVVPTALRVQDSPSEDLVG